MVSNNEKLIDIVAEDLGYDDNEELLRDCIIDGSAPAICTKCHSTIDDVEPDLSNGACVSCGEPSTVQSVLVLAEVI